jgi:hypothetical protein
MAAKTFRVAVTGDTGFDIFTEYVQGYCSADGRVKKPVAAYDVEVPSGAELTAIAFQCLLTPKGSIKLLVPTGTTVATPNTRSFTTLYKFLVELKAFKDVHRVTQLRPILDMDEIASPDVFDNLAIKSNAEIDLLVIHDGAGKWRKYPLRTKPKDNPPGTQDAMTLVREVLASGKSTTSSDYFFPKVLVNLNHDLPGAYRRSSGTLSFHNDLTFWKELLKYPNEVCVVCSANMLRREGAAISRRLSWEQTIEDLAADLQHFDKLAILSKFRHLVIRFGVSGALHLMNHQDGNRTADLIFAPRPRDEFYRDTVLQGSLLNQNVFLTAAIAQTIAKQTNRTKPQKAFLDALKTGVHTCLHAYDLGYSLPWYDDNGNLKSEHRPFTTKDGINILTKQFDSIKEVFRENPSRFKNPGDKYLGHAAVPPEILQSPPTLQPRYMSDWEILRRAIDGPTGSPETNESLDAHVSRINIGMAIVMHGTHAVLNRSWSANPTSDAVVRTLRQPAFSISKEELEDFRTLKEGDLPKQPSALAQCLAPKSIPVSIDAPMMTIGKALLMERREIESLRSIRNLFRAYVQRCMSPAPVIAPISIAVFGPPGSGKSFIVKQIAEDINRQLEKDSRKGLECVEYNVSQFRSIDDIGEAITRASVSNNEGKIPLIFFDEFDCKLDDQELGWLKYFLAPMQDGAYHGSRQTIRISRAIFVFAGGVYSTFSEFDPSTLPPVPVPMDAERKERLKSFRSRKGPDFTSRLRGHIDILPINSPDGEVKPIIRRAILLRSLLERYDHVANQRGEKEGNIDEDIVYALLTLDCYRHGARSMEAILQMCTPIDGRIEKASLPSRIQLHMHVDSDAFYVRVNRGRCRDRGQATIDAVEKRSLETANQTATAKRSVRRKARNEKSRAATSQAAAIKGSSRPGSRIEKSEETANQTATAKRSVRRKARNEKNRAVADKGLSRQKTRRVETQPPGAMTGGMKSKNKVTRAEAT